MNLRKPSLVYLSALMLCFQVAAGIKGKFVQINDIHYDPTYNTTGDSCNVGASARLKYGNYDCNPPKALLESAFYKLDMESSSTDTDFIVFNGDLVTHVRETDMLNETKVFQIIKDTATMMANQVKSGVPIFPVLGNHDHYPKDQLPDGTNSAFYRKIADDIFCKLFIGDDATNAAACTLFKKGGYYSKVIDNIRVIVLNTNLYYINNKAVQDGDLDPADQIGWLRKELDGCRQNKQKAHIFSHIPPGMMEVAENGKMFKELYNQELVTVFREFANDIIGVYSGHTHTDSFRIIYSKDDPPKAMVSVLISPSLTPLRWMGGTTKGISRNPAMRSVRYTTTADIKLREVEQFYLPLDVANKKASQPDQTVSWAQEYHFTRTYSEISDMSAQSLDKLVTEFYKDGSDDFHKYFDLNSVSIHENKDKPTNSRYYCDCRCKQRHLCTIQNVEYSKYYECMDNNLTCTGCRISSFLCLPVVALLVMLGNLFH